MLDPFAGSGTVGLAAVELGHTATLIELNPEYVREARCRLRAEAVSAAAITRSEPLVLNKSTTLYQGDCCELMQAIPDGTIDLVVIDPPFYRECQPLAAVFGLGQRLVRRYFDHRQGSRVSIWRIGWSAMRLRTSAR